MKKYVVEIDWDVTLFDNKDEALNHINYMWNITTENDRRNSEYFMCYEIEYDENINLDEVDDLEDLMTEKLVDYREENGI